MFNVYVPHFVCENLLAYIFSFLNESDIFTFIYYVLYVIFIYINMLYIYLNMYIYYILHIILAS